MRSTTPDFLIDGKPLLAPDSGVVLQRQDLESEASGVDERGIRHRIVLRPRLKKWTLRYKLLTGQEVRYLQGLFEEKDTVNFQYLLPGGTVESCTASCGEDTAALADSKEDLWENMVLVISEC